MVSLPFQHCSGRKAVGLKQIHGLVVVALLCSNRDDFVQSFVVFVTGDISSFPLGILSEPPRIQCRVNPLI